MGLGVSRRFRNDRKWKSAMRVYRDTGYKNYWYYAFRRRKRKYRKKNMEGDMIGSQHKLHMLMIGCSAFALLVTIVLWLINYFEMASLIRDTWWMLINVNLAPAIFTYILIWRTPEVVMKLWRPSVLYGFLIPMIGGPLGMMMAVIVLIQTA